MARLTLAKMSEPLPIHWSRPLPEGARPMTITLSRDSAGRYFVSFLVEEEITVASRQETVGHRSGLSDVVMLSTGGEDGQRALLPEGRTAWPASNGSTPTSRRAPGTGRRPAARWPAPTPASPTSRRDFLHKLTTRLIRENQTVCVESLAVEHLVRNHCLAKAIADGAGGNWSGNCVQSRLVRAHPGRDRPLVSQFQTLLCLRACTRLALLLRSGSGPARSAASGMIGTSTPQEYPCRGAHGVRLWRAGRDQT